MAALQKGSTEHAVPFSDVSHIHGMHMSFVLGLRHEGSGEPKERPRPLRRKVGKETKKAGGAMERLQQQLDALRKQLAGLQASVDGVTHQLEDTRDHIESSERRAEDTTDDLEEATEERDQAQGEVDVLKAEHERLKKEIEREESTILRLLRERSGDPALEMPEVTFGAEDRRAFKHAGQWAWSTLQSKSCWSCCLNDKRNSLGCAPVMNRLIHCEKSARRTKRSYRPRTAKT
jgi:predicted P-loop ATPase